MIRAALILSGLIAIPAYGQVVSPLEQPSVDTSVLATKAEVQAAQEAAAAAQAAIPVPASTVPNMEVVGGAAGSSNTFRRGDAVQPRISRTVSGTTGANGTATVTWPAMAGVPKLVVSEYIASTDTQVPRCLPVAGTVTTTGATIKCFRTQTLLGLGLVPFVVAPAGVQFDVLALPAS